MNLKAAFLATLTRDGDKFNAARKGRKRAPRDNAKWQAYGSTLWDFYHADYSQEQAVEQVRRVHFTAVGLLPWTWILPLLWSFWGEDLALWLWSKLMEFLNAESNRGKERLTALETN